MPLRVIFCFIYILLILLAIPLPGLSTDLDPTLTRNLFLIEQYSEKPDPVNTLRLVQSGIAFKADRAIRFYVYFHGFPTTADYDYLHDNAIKVFPRSWLPPVGAHPFGFMLAEGSATSIRKISDEARFPKLSSAERTFKPKNDLAAIETGAATAMAWQPPVTGAGVRLAILDSGFRFDHPDLPDPAAMMDYSLYPDTVESATDVISGHGTHVAGTAFGNGELSRGRWRGMAPGVEPIYFKIGDDSTGDATSEAVIGAVRGAATWAEADILSMSYGGWDGFNDGSSPEEQAVDWAVGEGTTVFMSAGNSAGDKEHYSMTVRANSTSDPIQVVIKFAPDSTLWGVAVVWYDGPDTSVHIDITAVLTDGDGSQISTDIIPRSTSIRGTDYQEYLARDIVPPDSTSYFIRLTNHSATDQLVHLWSLSSHWFVRFERADRSYTVLSPSSADSCISVGAYTSRNAWRDYQGGDHLDRTVPGEIASFSSLGPRIDGRIKPDICAPGRRLISCRDLTNITLDGGLDYAIISTDGDSGLPADYVAFMGTSMSSPAAAGSAALILSEEPDLTPAELRSRIFRRARHDVQTGQVPNNTWGYGKIDVVRALGIDGHRGSGVGTPEDFSVVTSFPNPTNGYVTVNFAIRYSEPLRVTMFDQLGRTVWEGELAKLEPGSHSFTIPGSAIVASGNYLIVIKGEMQHLSGRLTIVR